uniref:Uncharacterized protein n=1 Tax=Panagrellus redivivus TaxID=6233 RepID=A0A7E4W741_PANRE
MTTINCANESSPVAFKIVLDRKPLKPVNAPQGIRKRFSNGMVQHRQQKHRFAAVEVRYLPKSTVDNSPTNDNYENCENRPVVYRNQRFYSSSHRHPSQRKQSRSSADISDRGSSSPKEELTEDEKDGSVQEESSEKPENRSRARG